MKSFLLTICFLFAVAAVAQQPVSGDSAKPCLVSGTLTRYGSGEPIRGAEITVTRIVENSQGLENVSDPASTQVSVVTDRNGAFLFPHLPQGEYILGIRKTGFHGFRGQNSRTWEESMNFTLAPGQQLTDLDIAMEPGAVITGKVTDEDGDPMAFVQLSALKWVYANHHRQLRPQGMATTDDQGNYRIFNLAPGRYIVRASTTMEGVNSKQRYLPDYFPDTNSPLNATPIVVRAGDETSADFRMARGQAAKITGHVAGLTAGAQVQVYLHNTVDDAIGGRASGTSVDRNGNFTLDGVLPGDYVLGAMEFRTEGNESPRHAELPLRIDGDLSNVALTLEDAGRASLQGTLHLETGDVSHPPLSTLRIGLLPADDTTGNSDYVGTGGYSAVGRDGTIRIDKVSPGKYIVSMTADGNGWEDFYTKSVQVGNRDVTDGVINFQTRSGAVPITVTVGVDGALVDGTVLDDNGKPVANATVIGVPNDPALHNQVDLYQRGESDTNGRFILRGIKPGAYSFYAWNNMDDESYMDPDFLRRYENSRADLTLNPKDHQTLQLHLLTTDDE
ncbi:MAG TPA: carboxypeptidase-like regulatory domain-containing protein [Candidatus Koribacter sp.]